MLGGEQNTVDAENAYGYAAGLDYWIFGYYIDTGSYGRSISEARNLDKALRTFVSLPDRRGMKFAIQINQAAPREDTKYLENVVASYVRDRDYLRLEDGTAPLFVFTLSQWKAVLGTDVRVNEYFTKFTAGIKASAGIELKLIAVGGSVDLMRPYLKPNGPFSISTTYAHAPKCCAVAIPYEGCAATNREFWQGEQNTGLPFLPNVTMGWDWRPIIPHPDQMYDRKIQNPSWCEQGNPDQWIKVLRDAIEVGKHSAQQAGFSGVVIYAWNELSEGGWLVPTRKEGTARLEALASALSRHRQIGDIALRFPASSDGYEWPCPPGLSGAVKPTTPSSDELRVHAGPWLERSCKSGR